MLIVLALWWLTGIAGFVFWWTKDFDLRIGSALGSLLFGTMGPLAWLVGYFAHRDPRQPTVLIHRRGQR